MAAIDTRVVERLSARLDAQEVELASLRATVARLEGATPSYVLAMPAAVGGDRIRPVPAQAATTSRRTLLKGAGAALFTTALLATGEVVATEPFRVAAASPPPTGGMQTAVTADVVYQTFIGTDFLPEDFTRGSFGYSNNMGATTPGGGAIYQAEGAPVTGFAVRVGLPQGATITEVVFYLYCSDSTTSFVDMARYPTDFAIQGTLIGSATSTPLSSYTNLALGSLTHTTVDNTQYSYTIEWRPGSTSGQALFGARVGYTLPGSAQLYGSAQAGIGVSGLSSTGIGVQGQSDPAGGVGVRGVSASGFPIIGAITGAATVNAGVLGTGTKGPGVQGQSTGGYGLVGFTNATDGHAALIGYANATGGIGLMGYAPGGATPGVAGQFNGDVKINSGALHAPVMQAVIKHGGDGTYRLLHTLASPEGWFEDFGRGTLSGGKADIALDPDFAALVHTDDYHVFLTADGPLYLHLMARTPEGFTVAATALGGVAGGPKPAEGGGTFSWRVVAKRKDMAGERLAKVAPPPPLKPVTPFTVPQTVAMEPPTRKP